ncbi:hypothetical protein MUK70_11450 [Dyadobacter chenwenxiniae]|uniref:Protein argonaute n=1 Tax=Dyadobacter chenwenxiniae TaxID=2906456 RepID=A0A9X1PGM3_9BACT|nr:hypothetical protein [Dyadobacter chenwenxiniae]MCF0059855.1 hypothetical protein [Dyadobacter chenwenxiniae]UON85595.1 hypothetical protein MUK70_11450 [Dyadobacter chenwenxiniae]
MKPELLSEPLLEFGNDRLSEDPKQGITIGGFFSTSSYTHRSELHYALIGTSFGLEKTTEWIESFSGLIEATAKEVKMTSETKILDGEVIDEDDEDGLLFSGDFEDEFEDTSTEVQIQYEQNKRLNPDFPGFSSEAVFRCSFVNDETNNRTIKQSKVESILVDNDLTDFDRIVRICDLYKDAYIDLLTTSLSLPNLCFIVIPAKVFKDLSSIPFKGNSFFNLRRYLKAQLITLPGSIPVQIILEDTVLGKKKSLQDLSMQAWNFVVANYYKNGGTPWTLTLKDKHTCFIGISFHKVLNADTNLVRSSIAQAFNYEGKGIVFIGKSFKWDSNFHNTPAPHLTYNYAEDLIKSVIERYKRFNNNILPNRVVIHKTTDFWNSSQHAEYAEVEGLKDGIRKVLGDDVTIDLVTIKTSSIKLLRREGRYPVVRGTMLPLDQYTGVLYTTGYIPYYETYPGLHIPRPLEISIFEGESTLKRVCEEILALTKLNFNNCNFFDSLPITLRFAQKVGEIVQYADDDSVLPDKYFFYM